MSFIVLVAQLGAEAEADRAYAAEDIGIADFGAALPSLIRRLGVETSRSVREAIVVALERLTDPRVPEQTARLLTHEDAFLRNAAVGILQTKGVAALPEVKRALASPNVDLRKLGLDILSAVETPKADPLYEAALKDPDMNVQIAAVEYVGDHRNARFRARLEVLFADTSSPMLLSTLFAALSSIGADQSWVVIQERFPTFGDVPDFHRGSWLRALAQWGPPTAIETISGVAKDASVEDVIEAMRVLRDRFELRTVPAPLVDLLKSVVVGDAAAIHKFQALELLGSLTEVDAIAPFLVARLGSSDAAVASGARAALERLAPPGWEIAAAPAPGGAAEARPAGGVLGSRLLGKRQSGGDR